MQAGDRRDLEKFATQAPALITQLQGLTIVCEQPFERDNEWAAPYRPIPLLTALTSLTSKHSLCRLGLAVAFAIAGGCISPCLHSFALVWRTRTCMCSVCSMCVCAARTAMRQRHTVSLAAETAAAVFSQHDSLSTVLHSGLTSSFALLLLTS
jgi:hypothetical protein